LRGKYKQKTVYLRVKSVMAAQGFKNAGSVMALLESDLGG
jgi:chemotaxis methyl-accepting protein methylase